ncbi:MAG TPA: tRNA uridine-5-carboxymethylaminomethyl(34) synthesis GTPase MnmE [Candidatus Acidoferrum sp.]|nr:tRNA uridine-5-carboxymethylaminomethyl(34) synthesis GTPase MnmE [Candidatus Acidoferrum sp.]
MSSRKRKALGGDETIVAVITPPGEGGIAALRLAGPNSRTIALKFLRSSSEDPIDLQPFVLRYAEFVAGDGVSIDEVTSVFMPLGRSYTGLEQVEIFCHGGRQVVRMILDELIKSGARPAEPGEFTKLAFLNGRIDLARAEAVAEIIASGTESSFRASREHLLGAYSEHIDNLRNELIKITAEVEASIDFPEEEIRAADSDELTRSLSSIGTSIHELIESYSGGRIITEGFTIAICGRPNAGKSSLFNLLLKQERALVHEVPGTTRDYISEWIELGGVAVNLIDTAGLRTAGGKVEKEGQKRALEIVSKSHLVLWVVDSSVKGWERRCIKDVKSLRCSNILVVSNKNDLVRNNSSSLDKAPAPITVRVSCQTGFGIKELKHNLVARISEKMPDFTSGMVVTSARHKKKLAEALTHIKASRRKISADDSPELVAFELRQATTALEEITGKVYTEQILDQIFGKFCIGK